jgi:hypothetical protein
MRGHGLLEARQPRKPLKAAFTASYLRRRGGCPLNEEGLFGILPATEIAFKLLHRSVGEEEHPLLVSCPHDLDLSSPSVHIAPVEREDLEYPGSGPEEPSTRTRTPSDGLPVLRAARATFLFLTRDGTNVDPGGRRAESGGPCKGGSSSRGSQARRTSGRAAVRPPTPADTSRMAPENGDPIRYQKRSQRVTRHPTGLVGPDVTKRQAQRGISAFAGPKKWWTGGELNSRHRDFQSRALPTELPVHRAREDRLKRP